MADDADRAKHEAESRPIELALAEARTIAGHNDPAVLTGWALVAEWAVDDGTRHLSRMHAPGTTAWVSQRHAPRGAVRRLGCRRRVGQAA